MLAAALFAALVGMVAFGSSAGAQATGVFQCASPGPGAIVGGPGPDVLTGTPGDDLIVGNGGDDIIVGGGGNDIICGGDGDDSIWGQGGDDDIIGEAGNDRIRGGDGNDWLHGDGGDDDLAGGRGNDIVDGGDGVDSVRGGTGDDQVFGSHGDDTRVSGNGGSDVVDGGAGNDLILGGPRPDTMRGGIGNDIMRGLGGADSIFGEGGDDELLGGKQPDKVLDGGTGTDSCSGGAQLTAPGAVINCENPVNFVDANGVEIGSPDTPPVVPEPTDTPSQNRYELSGGLVLKTTASTTAQQNSDGSETFAGAMAIESAPGDISLPNVSLSLIRQGGVWTIVEGSADLMLPSGGVFDQLVSPMIASDGLQIKRGSELTGTGAPVQADRSYFVLSLGGPDTTMSTLFGDDDDEVALPSGFSVAGGGESFLVVDPSDPFIFIGGTQCEFSFSLEISEPDPGDETDTCGIAFSYNGSIPYPESSRFVGRPGHVSIEGIIPLYKGLTLTGEVVVGIDERGLDLTAIGEFDLGLKFLRNAPVDLEIPVGGGIIELSSSDYARFGIGVDMAVWIDGEGGAPEDFELPIVGIPISMPSSPDATLSSRLYFTNEGTTASPNFVLVEEWSFVEISGSFSMNPTELNGSPMIAGTQQGTIRIDGSGIQVTATQTADLHELVQTSGTVTVDAYISWTDITYSYLRVDGNFSVFGVPVGEAQALINSDGFTVSGHIDAGGVIVIDVSGAISTNSFLEGSVSVNLDTSEAIAAAANALGEARTELETTRADVQQGLEDASQALRDASAAVATAQAGLAGARSDLADLDRQIADLEYAINNCSGFLCELAPGPLLELAGLQAARAGYVTAVSVADELLGVAQDALDGIRSDIIDQVDGDVFVTIASDTLASAQTLVNEVNSVLPRMVISGNLNARVDSSGLRASFSGTGCIAGSCSSLSGSVEITSSYVEVCTIVPGVSQEVCARL